MKHEYIRATVTQNPKFKRFKANRTRKKSGVSQQLISRIENEKIDSTNEVFSLADALGVNAKWLATGEGGMETEKRTASDASEEEMRLLNLLRSLTKEQQRNVIASVEQTKQQNDNIIKELSEQYS